LPFYQLTAGEPGLPVLLVAAYALTFFVLSFFIISRLLENNDLTYRRRAQAFNGGWDAGR